MLNPSPKREEYNSGRLQAPDLRRTVRLIETWFARHQRPLPWRDAYDPYHVWLSEVMAQQTRLDVALPYFERFVARFPTLADLAVGTEDEGLSEFWMQQADLRVKIPMLGKVNSLNVSIATALIIYEAVRQRA